MKIVLKNTETAIAPMAKKRSHFACLMIVIDGNLKRSARTSILGSLRLLADSTKSVLRREHRGVFVEAHSIQFQQPRITTLLVNLRTFEALFGLNFSRACLAALTVSQIVSAHFRQNMTTISAQAVFTPASATGGKPSAALNVHSFVMVFARRGFLAFTASAVSINACFRKTVSLGTKFFHVEYSLNVFSDSQEGFTPCSTEAA